MHKALLWPQLLSRHDFMHLVINIKDVKNNKSPFLIQMILISCGFCNITLLCFLKVLTRMHSSRMRTVRCSVHLGVGSLPGGVSWKGCLPRGVSTQGVYTSPPVERQTPLKT